MTVKDKIQRIVARNPELKDTIISLQDTKTRELFNKIVEKNINKLVLIGKSSEDKIGLYILAYILNHGYPHITHITTVDLLDAYVDRDLGTDEDTPSLSTYKDDLMVIKDSRAFVPNKQKTNMILQVFEQNDSCFYYYKGTEMSFMSEHEPLIQFAKDNNIQITKIQDKR